MAIVQKLFETAVKISRYDQKAWDKLYFGIRQDIKQGIKHGLSGGAAAGTFIDEDGTGVNGGQILQPQTYKPDKTRRGTSTSFARQRFTSYKYRQSRRQSCSCKSRGSSYRFKSQRFLRNRRSRGFRNKYNGYR